jgi:hypothetical protein
MELKIFYCKKYPSWKVINQEEFKNLKWSILTFAPPTFQKIEHPAVTFLAITYPSTRGKNICLQMTEWLKRHGN